MSPEDNCLIARMPLAAGEAVALAFEDQVDCARGDLLASGEPAQSADQFEATIIWMAEDELLPGRHYVLKIGTQTVPATVQSIRHRIGIDSHAELAARTLALNEIGVANIATARPIVFEPYERSRTLGGFILIDRLTNATAAAGLIHFALRRSQNLHEQALTVSPERRAALKGQEPRLLWFTGLSGAGKSTIANLVEAKLLARGRHTFLLDGDNVRLGLNKDLGFTDADRVENIRRSAEAAKLMLDAGLIVLTAFISPFRAERDMVRRMLPPGRFIEITIVGPSTSWTSGWSRLAPPSARPGWPHPEVVRCSTSPSTALAACPGGFAPAADGNVVQVAQHAREPGTCRSRPVPPCPSS